MLDALKTTEKISEGQQNLRVDTVLKATEPAKYVFTAPNPLYTVLPIIVISLILGYFLFNNIYLGLGLFAIPTFISGFISKPLAEIFKGKFYFRRSFLLALVSLILIFTIVFIGLAIQYFYKGLTINIILIFSFSFIIFIRHTILVSTSNSSHLFSFLATINQSALFFCFFYFLPKMNLTERELILGIIFSATFLIFAIIFTEVISLSYRRNFNYNGLTLLKMTLDQITEGSIELEKFYKSFAQKVKLPIKIISFKKINKKQETDKTDGNVATKNNNQQIKALIIVPSVHPGPFGNICSADLPYKIAKNFSFPILVPHSASTHDYNLAETKEVEKIVSEVKKLLSEVKYENTVSKFFREEKNVVVNCQLFGENAFITYTASPSPTDDVDISVGKEVENIANKFIKNSVFVDAHNCNKRGEGHISFGSEKTNEIFSLTEKVIASAKENLSEIKSRLAENKEIENFANFKLGYAENKKFTEKEGIGKQGIQVLAIEVNERKNAYVLIDGNNMVMGLREKIMNSLNIDCEILTTDNHALNTANNNYNPIGLLLKEEKMLLAIKETVKNAFENLENCEVGFNKGEIPLFVHGEGNTVKLSATINSAMSIMKYVFALSLISAIMVCFFVGWIFR